MAKCNQLKSLTYKLLSNLTMTYSVGLHSSRCSGNICIFYVVEKWSFKLHHSTILLHCTQQTLFVVLFYCKIGEVSRPTNLWLKHSVRHPGRLQIMSGKKLTHQTQLIALWTWRGDFQLPC